MNRRELLRWSAGAAAAAGSSLQAQQRAVPPQWKPSVFDAHQLATVTALCDLIIPTTDTPGAAAAGVPRYLDTLLAEMPVPASGTGRRETLLEGLAWLDGHSIEKHGSPFVRVKPADQVAMLTALDEAAEGAGARYFRAWKSTISQIYYNTAAGYRELNKGGRVPASVGCKHAKHA